MRVKFSLRLAMVSLLLLGTIFLVHIFKEKTVTAPPVPPKILVLMYHKVNSDPASGGLGLRVTGENFEQQMEQLKKLGYQSINPDELLDYLEGKGEMWPKAVLLTFDDGYLDNYTVARPILLKQDFRATFFLVSGRIGTINTWDTARGGVINQLMTQKNIETMLEEGFWVGSHTTTHSKLSNVPISQAREEILGSKAALEKLFNIKIKYFCYPYGSYNRQVVNLVRESGYRAGLTTAQGQVALGDNVFTLKRIRITGHYDLQQFLQVIGEE